MERKTFTLHEAGIGGVGIEGTTGGGGLSLVTLKAYKQTRGDRREERTFAMNISRSTLAKQMIEALEVLCADGLVRQQLNREPMTEGQPSPAQRLALLAEQVNDELIAERRSRRS